MRRTPNAAFAISNNGGTSSKWKCGSSRGGRGQTSPRPGTFKKRIGPFCTLQRLFVVRVRWARDSNPRQVFDYHRRIWAGIEDSLEFVGAEVGRRPDRGHRDAQSPCLLPQREGIAPAYPGHPARASLPAAPCSASRVSDPVGSGSSGSTSTTTLNRPGYSASRTRTGSRCRMCHRAG